MKNMIKIFGGLSALYLAYCLGYDHGVMDQYESAKHEFDQYRKEKQDVECRLIDISEYLKVQRNLLAIAYEMEKGK